MATEPQPNTRACPQCGESNNPQSDICWKCRWDLRANRPWRTTSSCWTWGCGILLVIVLFPIFVMAVGNFMTARQDSQQKATQTHTAPHSP